MTIRLAIISDIHGNILALDEVLKDISTKKIDQTYCLGDLIDFAPWNNEVVTRIRNLKIPCLQGNHDERVSLDLPILSLSHQSGEERAMRILAIEHSKATISKKNKEWMSKLPHNIELGFKIGKKIKKILLVHASLKSNDEYIHESDPKEDFIKELSLKGIDVVIMGHTHLSYIQKTNGVTLINCGSVGRTKEKDRRASYAIVTISDDRIDAEIIKIKYPIKKVAKAIFESEIPNYYGHFLLK